jgi:NitT/TauT family transport system substrate-binding protein
MTQRQMDHRCYSLALLSFGGPVGRIRRHQIQRRVSKETTMKHALPAIIAVAAVGLMSPAGAQDKPEMPKVRLAVGGKSAIFYLPLSITERLGYFRDAGLEVEIADVQSGARALQSLVGGSAEVGVGTFDHTIQMQSKGQPVVAVTQYGHYPGFVLATIASKSIAYRGPQSLKGLTIGVTSPGSSTHFMAAYMLVRSGLKADDASFVGTGVTSTAVAAARRADIDAIVSSDPMISLMQSDGLVKVVADTRTPEGTRAVYGGPYPGGVVYTTADFIANRARLEMDVGPPGRGHRHGGAAGICAWQPRGLCEGLGGEPGDVLARWAFRSRRGRDRL